MTIILRDSNIEGITTIVDNGKLMVAIDIDGKVTVIPKADVVTVSPN